MSESLYARIRRRVGRLPALGVLVLLSVAATGPLDAQVEAPAAERVDTLAAGVVHQYVRDGEGPWAIHVVEVAPEACGVSVRAVKAGERVVAVERTSEMAARVGAGDRPALAAVNADFFRAEPFGAPEGPHVTGGVVVASEGTHGPSVAQRFDVEQPVFGVTLDGGWFVAEARLAGEVWRGDGARRPLERINAAPADPLTLYNAYFDDAVPTQGNVALAILGAAHRDPAAPGTEAVLLRGGGEAAEWLRATAPEDTLTWALRFEGAPGPVAEMVGGFPLLLEDGEPVLDRVEEFFRPFSEGRHPRTAVGIRPDGTLLLVAVDGRQPGYSEGMTLAELVTLFQELGATDAINLDGGGSTTVVVGERVVSRPSDPVERPVTNALVLLGPAPGECP